MSEEKKDTLQKGKVTTSVEQASKVGLVELIMVLLLVGLVFVVFFGMRQLKVDKAAEALAQTKFESIIPTIQKVIASAESFKKADQFGDYPFDIDQMNLGKLDTDDFKVEYDGEGYKIVVVTLAAFGKEGIRVAYSLNDRSYQIEDPNPEKKPTIKDEWLPQE